MRNSSMELRVKKDTDEKELKKDLMKINFKFFETCRLDILKRQTIRRFTYADATNLNDEKKNKIALTSSNDFTNDNQTAQMEDECLQ